MEWKQREEFANVLTEMCALKPCPFCGSTAKFELWQDGSVIITCTKCGCRTMPYITDNPIHDLPKVWNRRR